MFKTVILTDSRIVCLLILCQKLFFTKVTDWSQLDVRKENVFVSVYLETL